MASSLVLPVPPPRVMKTPARRAPPCRRASPPSPPSVLGPCPCFGIAYRRFPPPLFFAKSPCLFLPPSPPPYDRPLVSDQQMLYLYTILSFRTPPLKYLPLVSFVGPPEPSSSIALDDLLNGLFFQKRVYPFSYDRASTKASRADISPGRPSFLPSTFAPHMRSLLSPDSGTSGSEI